MNVEALIKTSAQLPLERRTIIHLILIGNRINESLNQCLKPHGVSLQQFNVLRILRGQKGQPANLSTLNHRMVYKMSNTSRLVDKLVDKGLVERKVCPSNRRKVEIRLTPAGSKALEAMDQTVDATETDLMQGFSVAEMKQLNSLLDQFWKHEN